MELEAMVISNDSKLGGGRRTQRYVGPSSNASGCQDIGGRVKLPTLSRRDLITERSYFSHEFSQF